MWSNFFYAGGWGMYPVTIFGVIFVAVAFLFLIRPERRFTPVVVASGILTVGAGLLGTSVGFVNSFRYLGGVAPDKQVEIAALGCAESLNNLILALMLTVASTLLVWGGFVRTVLRPSAE